MSAASLVIDLLMKTGSFETDSKRAEAIVKKRTQAMKKEFAAMANDIKGIMVSISAGAEKLIAVQREFDGLNASLETITGNSQAAQKEFSWIQKFAAQTPFSLSEVTNAFIKLKLLGLDASEKSLRSYGNTATAMNKDLIQLIEAVADAATGEFERLKEFGITAKQNGDKVALTFNGLTKVIGNNSKEITKYLTDIGNNNFSVSMEKRMKSLDGAISNLSDSWDQFWLSLSNKGIGSFFAEQARKAAEALETFTKINNLIDAQNKQNGWNQNNNTNNSEGNWMVSIGNGLSEAYIAVNIARQQAMAISEGYGTAINALLRGNIDDYNTATRMMDEDLEKLKKNSADALSAIENYKTTNVPIHKYDIEYSNKKTGVGGQTAEEIKKQAEAEKERQEIIKESEKVFKDTRTAAENLAIELDRLAKLKNSPHGISQDTYERAVKEANDALNAPLKNEAAAIYDKTRTAAEKLAIELQKLDKLKNLNLIDNDTYYRERANIQNILNEDIENLKKKEIEKQKAIQESKDSLYSGLLNEEEAIEKSYKRRRQEILTATEISNTERADLMTRLNANLVKQMEEFKEKNYWKEWAKSATVNMEDVNELLRNTAENFTSGFGTAFESMIFDSKSFGDAMRSMATSMARSFINAVGQMIAQLLILKTLSSVFNISTGGIGSLAGIIFSGRASGGPVMGNTPYLVGERGAELFVPNTSGAVIPNDKLGGGNITVNLIENAKKAGKTEEKQTNGRRELDIFVADLIGDGPRSKAIQRSFGLQRRGY